MDSIPPILVNVLVLVKLIVNNLEAVQFDLTSATASEPAVNVYQFSGTPP